MERIWHRLNTLTAQQAYGLVAAFALLLSVSGFVLEYGFGVLPCPMCWWQRYIHWAIGAVAVVGMAKPVKPLWGGIALLALAGLAIAGWQFAAQNGWLPFPASCTSASAQALATGGDLLAAMEATRIVPCDLESFKLLGVSLAGWNLPAMAGVLGLAVMRLLRR